MENLFRLVLTRPPVTQNEDTPSVPLVQDSQFQAALGAAQQTENKREVMKRLARAFMGTAGFTGNPKDLPIYEQLKALVALEKSAQGTQALIYVGNNVAVDGSIAQFDGSKATWNFIAPKDSNATITITNSAGQTVYSGKYNLSEGNASFVWDGKGNDGTQWPAGTYKMSATAKDSSGNDVAISTEVQGVVDSVDLTADPPLLSIGGQNYTTSQIKRIVRAST